MRPYQIAMIGKNPLKLFRVKLFFRQQFEKGILKVYGAFDRTNFQLTQEDINNPSGVNFKLNNNNFYTNLSYSGDLSSSWKIFGGGSYTFSKSKFGIGSTDVEDTENSAHLKLKLRKRFSSRFKLSFGAEQFLTDFNEGIGSESFNGFLRLQ